MTLPISYLLYIESIPSDLLAIRIGVRIDLVKRHWNSDHTRPIMPTTKILLEYPIETPQTAAQVEASCTFVTSADHQRLVSSD